MDRLLEPQMLDRIRAARGDAAAVALPWDRIESLGWDAESVDAVWNKELLVRQSLSALTSSGSLNLAPGSDPRRPVMRRQDVFGLVPEMSDGPTEESVKDFVVNVNAWGYGDAGYAGHRTEAVVTEAAFEASAGGALARLNQAVGPDEYPWELDAYFFLLNNVGHVDGWGPAFFTKFLYFGDRRNQPGQAGGALILDQVMSERLRDLVVDTSVVPGRYRFRSSRWTTPEYAFYLAIVRRVAHHVGCRADRVEAVLFNQGRA